MTLHFQEGLDLSKGQILSVPQSDQFIIGTEQFESIAQNLPLIQALTDAGGDLGEKVETVDVLQDVRLAVRNQDNV